MNRRRDAVAALDRIDRAVIEEEIRAAREQVRRTTKRLGDDPSEAALDEAFRARRALVRSLALRLLPADPRSAGFVSRLDRWLAETRMSMSRLEALEAALAPRERAVNGQPRGRGAADSNPKENR